MAIVIREEGEVNKAANKRKKLIDEALKAEGWSDKTIEVPEETEKPKKKEEYEEAPSGAIVKKQKKGGKSWWRPW